MIRWLYERHLARQLAVRPERICVLLSDRDLAAAPGKIRECVEWCREAGIGGVIFHISTADPDGLAPYLPELRRIAEVARLTLHLREDDRVRGNGHGGDGRDRQERARGDRRLHPADGRGRGRPGNGRRAYVRGLPDLPVHAPTS